MFNYLSGVLLKARICLLDGRIQTPVLFLDIDHQQSVRIVFLLHRVLIFVIQNSLENFLRGMGFCSLNLGLLPQNAGTLLDRFDHDLIVL